MIEFHGKFIPTKLEELVHPKYTAIVVVDMQNDFFVEGGASYKLGKYLHEGDTIVKKIKLLIQEAREVGVKIFYLQNTALPNYLSDSAAWLHFRMKHQGLKDPSLVPEVTLEGSWGQRITKDIEPRYEDFVVRKNRASGFIGTNLDKLLRINSIKNLLITGIVTHGCILATAGDAQYHDYFVVILRDCVDSSSKELHDAALKIMEKRMTVVDSDQIIKIWKKLLRRRRLQLKNLWKRNH